MKRLWAGWRMLYVNNTSHGKGEGCLFCRLALLKPAVDNLVLERGEESLIVMNAFPYNCGHLMVAPLRHRAFLNSVSSSEQTAIWRDLARCEAALKKAYRPHGINIGVNLGRPAGAGVLGHLHFHLVPRWNGDTNFMPVIANTKVLPETMDATYLRLKNALAESKR